MKISAEQLFFGSGTHGYGLLAASPGAELCREPFVRLCESVGTQDSSYSGEPILLSRPVGDRLLVVRCGFGQNDSAGRRTLFFHGLVLPFRDCRESGISAFSIADSGAFRMDAPVGRAAPVMLDLPQGAPQSGSCGFRLPAVVKASHPTEALFRNLLGNRVNEISWSTYAFWPTKDLELYALSLRAPDPSNGVSFYDESGKSLEPVHSVFDDNPDPARIPPKPSGANHSVKGFNWTIVSLALNVVLVFACFSLFLQGRRSEPQLPPAEASDVQKITEADLEVRYQSGWNAGHEQAEKEFSERREVELSQAEMRGAETFFRRLQSDLPEKIDGLDSSELSSPSYRIFSSFAKISDAHDQSAYENDVALFLRLQRYVNFVNTNFWNAPQR